MDALLDELGLLAYVRPTGLIPAGLRAGGATHVLLSTQDVALVKWCGRRQTDKTLEHYLQDLGSCSLLATLGPDLRERITACASYTRSLLEMVTQATASHSLASPLAASVHRKV